MKKVIFSAFSVLFASMGFAGFFFLAAFKPMLRTGFDRETAAVAKLQLGHRLFFDTRLSVNNTKSCASCHEPRLAFTDGYRRSSGAFADLHRHNAPSLLNLNSFLSLDWANIRVTALEQQIEKPMFGQEPIEIGADKTNAQPLVDLIRSDEQYRRLYADAFGRINPKHAWSNAISALAVYVTSLQSRNSAYDAYISGNEEALTPAAREGMRLFFSQKAGCINCHSGPDFNQALAGVNAASNFHNIGLFQTYPENDCGLKETTGLENDEGRFRAPSLRNVAITAPYMHDGSVATLDACIRIFEEGGRITAEEDGRLNMFKSHTIRGFEATDKERFALISFLESLTDTTYLNNPVFTNPF